MFCTGFAVALLERDVITSTIRRALVWRPACCPRSHRLWFRTYDRSQPACCQGRGCLRGSMEWSPGRLPGLRSCRRFRAGAGPQVIEVLAGPGPVVVVEQPADGIDHELGVAGVQVELAEVAAVAVGDGDGRLD